ncbi:MAG TPA: DUF4124 domain-containing protein, partial [Nitrospirae bacterium]|nr:DUF4124 domain-containing protein [Nitrospirota bacterium]
YKWVDHNGNLHFSDSPASIPPEYREQAEVNEFGESGSKKPLRKATKNDTMEISPEPVETGNKPGLNKYEIPYIAYEGAAKRIIVAVVLNGYVTANMALDTGAPGTIISFALAEKLGMLHHNEGALVVTAGGIGGTTPAIRTVIDSIRIGGAEEKFIPTTVVKIPSSAFEGLIGMDIMSNYSLRIDPRRRMVILEEIPSSPNQPGGHDEMWWRTYYSEFSAYKKGWKAYMKFLDTKLSESGISLSTRDLIFSLKDFSGKQYREADRLFFKLNSYATDNAVPMSWREY